MQNYVDQLYEDRARLLDRRSRLETERRAITAGAMVTTAIGAAAARLAGARGAASVVLAATGWMQKQGWGVGKQSVAVSIAGVDDQLTALDRGIARTVDYALSKMMYDAVERDSTRQAVAKHIVNNHRKQAVHDHVREIGNGIRNHPSTRFDYVRPDIDRGTAGRGDTMVA